jgi:cobalt-zinc-cadmium efflux system membrane fusion protein
LLFSKKGKGWLCLYANSTPYFNHFQMKNVFFSTQQLLAGLVVLCFFSACEKEPNKTTPPPTSVGKPAFVLNDSMAAHMELAEATVETVKGQLTLNGKVSADENNVMDVFPLLGGNVREINALLGQRVSKGQDLAVIFSSEIAEYDKDRREAEQNLELAEKSLKNAQEMYEAKIIAEKEMLPMRYEVEKIKLVLKRLDETKKMYGGNANSEYVVKAPMSGFIVHKNISKDQVLRPDNAASIYTIAEINEVWILANVYEADIARVKEGQTAQIQVLSYPDEVFTGKIDRIFNVLDPATQTMKVRITLPNAGYKLKPEMNCVVNLQFDETQQLIAVPSKSVVFDKSKNFVMVFKDKNNIETREVSIYKTVGDKTYITQGLQTGEKVISQQQLFIYDAIND